MSTNKSLHMRCSELVNRLHNYGQLAAQLLQEDVVPVLVLFQDRIQSFYFDSLPDSLLNQVGVHDFVSVIKCMVLTVVIDFKFHASFCPVHFPHALERQSLLLHVLKERHPKF